MPKYSQAGRSILLTTPLGTDQLLLVGFRGQEAISRLFRFELDLLAEVNTDVHFEDIIGQDVSIQMRLANDESRYFNGIVKRFSQGGCDERFTAYHAEVVPKLWLLTKTVQSRIFQNMSVPDILNEVLSGFDFTFKLSGTYYPRNYCVQYRESDFDFASRLMEDEGIYYFFHHSDGAHQMVVTDAQTSYPEIPGQSNFLYEARIGGVGEKMRIRTWEKAQDLRSAQYTVRDYCFEMPSGTQEESNPTIDQVKVGAVTHKLNLAGDDLEIYDYPGGCAKRYDGIDSQGGAFAEGFTQMSEDRSRIVRVRMEEEECASLEITGSSDCGNLAAGYALKLQGHFNGDGEYLLTRVEHSARQTGYETGEKDEFSYDNRFVCMPTGLIYRPRRVTPKPVIAGVQTATVTGPPGETTSGQSVFCDRYGRVKVHFHWDREGKMDSGSSCWLRVAQFWAGNGWGAFFWPRIGHEVVVAFEEGDPDQPLIVGSVYNAVNLPPYTLPDSNQLAGIRSASVRGDAGQNFNGVVFDDKKGDEHLAIHSEHNMILNAECDKMVHGGRDQGERVARTRISTVGGLPGVGGGSGGGAMPPVWGQEAQGGINVAAIYGDNVAFTFGGTHTVAGGAFGQLVVAPAHLLEFIPGVAQLLGGSVGGQNNFTIGPNTVFVYGANFQIQLTPEKEGGNTIDLKVFWGESGAICIYCQILAAIVAIWTVAYALLGFAPDAWGEGFRSGLVVACQLAIAATQTGIVYAAKTLYAVKKAAEDLQKATLEKKSKEIELKDIEFELRHTELV
ncbi:MAG: type VI secretion system tip protein TssI/VgrG [Acidobacteriota bacterium]|nr:type VI secretion system tip protein TssI/VgrG [Acidobacteriota bacterium]